MPRQRRYNWPRLRAVLNGCRGYAAQQEAWDAVLPGWREGLALVMGSLSTERHRLTAAESEQMDRISAALNADNRRLARSWSKLLSQGLYRRCPALGGWFPD